MAPIRDLLCLSLVPAAIVVSDARAQAEPATATLDPVVVTATRRAERSFDVPASVESIDGAVIRDGQPGISLLIATRARQSHCSGGWLQRSMPWQPPC